VSSSSSASRQCASPSSGLQLPWRPAASPSSSSPFRSGTAGFREHPWKGSSVGVMLVCGRHRIEEEDGDGEGGIASL
jgi:hypothetical protein